MITKSLARNVIWNWMGTVCDAAIAFVLAPFLIHHLGAATYGVWILIGSMSGYFGLLDLGVRGSVGRYIAFYSAEKNPDAVNRTLTTAFVFCCAIAFVVFLLLPLIELCFFRAFDVPAQQVESTRLALRLIVVNLALTFPLSLFDGTLWAHQRFDLLNMVDIPASLTRAAVTLWLVSHGFGLAELAILTLGTATCVGLAKAILSFRINPELRIAPRCLSRESARELFGYGAFNFIITIARMTRIQFTPLLIGALLSPVAVTFYSIPKRLLDYTEKLFAATTGMLTPMSASLQAQGKELLQQQLILRASRVMTTLGAVFLVFYLALGRSLIVLWMGAAWDSAYTLLIILALGEMLVLTQIVNWNFLYGTAKHASQALFHTLDIVVVAALAFAFASADLTGLCIAIAASGAVFRGLVVLVCGCRAAGIPLRRYMGEAFFPGLLSALPPALILGIAALLHAPTRWPVLLVYSAVYGLLSAVACFMSMDIPLAKLWSAVYSRPSVPQVIAHKHGSAELEQR